MVQTLDLPRRLAAARAAVLDWRPPALAALCALLLLLAAQWPLAYRFHVGVERGPHSDRPFIASFYTPEGQWPDGMFRWTRGEAATITLPGAGRRELLLALEIVSHRANRDPAAPPTRLTLHPGAAAPIRFTLRREAATYHLYLPPQALPDGALRLRLETATWQPPGDSRDELGVAIGRVRAESTRSRGLTPPDLGVVTCYPLALLLLWPLARLIGFPARAALHLLLPLALAIPLMAVVDPGRLAFGAVWSVQAALIGLASGALGLWLAPPLLLRLGAPAPEGVLRWLLLLVVVGFALKYSARLYPDSMPGDLQLHLNRFGALVRGQHFIDAQHRGLPFPFPTGLYILAAPLTLSGIGIRDLFPLLSGAFEASGALLMYALLARAAGSPRLGLLAAALYALTAGGAMTAWFAFFSHVSTQWYQLALMVLLAASWPRYGERLTWWGIVLLLAQVALGHIGTFINLAIFAVLLLPLLWQRARTAEERHAVLDLLAAGALAAAFVFLAYYSVRLPQFVSVLQGIAAEGMADFTGKRPIPPAETLAVLWQGGLIEHFGFFPVLLALPGALLLARGPAGRGALPVLMLATALSSLSQALLPLITHSSITTRWLMFSAWVVAAAAAPAVRWLWRRGPAGRLLVLGMAGYVLWISAVVWIEAMTMRLPPIEPF
ncbi:MAG TPA: hypothetical protein VNL77_17250 [Roseiflexaceae bacterium]|nr:hypothetical protein [Roseiflexaceae bacterium]